MRYGWRVVVCVGLILGPVVAAADGEGGRSPLHGALPPGPHGVGFARIEVADPSRPAGSVRAGAAGPASADRARRIGVHIWYPSRRGAGARALTLRDYFSVHQGANDGLGDPDRVAVLRRFLARFGTVSDAAFEALTATPLLAVRDAVPAPERFPLVIGLLRPVATTITNEFLASHGYVVAMVSGDQTPEPADAGRALEIPLRDMEFAIPHLRQLPYVAPAGLATLGFSGSGFSQILLGMRHPDVDAVCDLESAIFDDGVLWPLSRGWGYDLAALRIPFLHTYSVPLSRRENRRADFEGMRYSTRFHYLVDAPGIDHADFATEGMVASVMPGLRGDQAPRLRQAFETTNRYVLAFFDAYVKRDPRGLAFLRADPTANGVPAGLVTIRELPAIEPAPTPDAFVGIITGRGLDQALRVFAEAGARDPDAPLFTEAALNRIGYRLLRDSRPTEAVAILRTVVDRFPRSLNALDSLSEALETAGRRADAADIVRRGLALAPTATEPAPQREALTRLLQERLARLSATH